MPDITMCVSGFCPLKRGCYRHEASGTKSAGRVQSMSEFKWSWIANSRGAKVACYDYVPVRDPDPRFMPHPDQVQP